MSLLNDVPWSTEKIGRKRIIGTLRILLIILERSCSNTFYFLSEKLTPSNYHNWSRVVLLLFLMAICLANSMAVSSIIVAHCFKWHKWWLCWTQGDYLLQRCYQRAQRKIKNLPEETLPPLRVYPCHSCCKLSSGGWSYVFIHLHPHLMPASRNRRSAAREASLNRLKASSSNTLPSARFHFIKVLELSTSADQVCKHSSLWGVLYIQTTVPFSRRKVWCKASHWHQEEC